MSQDESVETSKQIDLTPDKNGGVLKEILKVGDENEGSPSTGDKVVVHYKGTLLSGEKFDSSRDRGEKFEFTLGTGQVIKAWDLGVASMKKGEVARLTCQSDYAYSGSLPKIPPKGTLIFVVKLYSWKDDDDDDDDGGESFNLEVLKRSEEEGELQRIKVNGLIFVRDGINKLYGKRTKKTIEQYQEEFKKLEEWGKRVDLKIKDGTPVEPDMMGIYLIWLCQNCENGKTSIIQNAYFGINYYHNVKLLPNPFGYEIVIRTRKMCLANVESIQEIIAQYIENNAVNDVHAYYWSKNMMRRIAQQCFKIFPE